ncbi:MAG: hypothetical protein CMF63_04985, partial [Magnetovibrio sp.]|nr:hypothetical protein [Magnetovibrio sp.]
TAAQGQERGIERSLAGAFLKSGASAVVSTHWPVRDREFQGFVEALVDRWPFPDPALAVARVCRRLRRQGAPPRVWGAPVVS